MDFFAHPAVTKEEWNAFVGEHGGSFLQSYEWGEFQRERGRGLERVTVVEQGVTLAAASVIRQELPFKKWYWYVPFGPVLARAAGGRKDVCAALAGGLKERAPANMVFIKIEPDHSAGTCFPLAGFQKSPASMQVRETVIIHLTENEEVLLARMKQKTRYNIRVAERHGVTVASLDEQETLDPELFLDLLSATAKRNRFHLHSRDYYRAMMVRCSGPEPTPGAALTMRLFYALHEGVVVAAALVGFFGNRATYLHGASSDEHKNTMAPYLLHWDIMRYAKGRGFAEYDLWGVATERSDRKTRAMWGGITRFKQGFGGEHVVYPGAQDLPLDMLWYNAYKIARATARAVRRLKR